MNKQDFHFFNILKKKVAETFLKSNNAPNSIEDWKGNSIVLFQEDLFAKVKGRVSEKWFYTYFKNNSDKLPRIDMLNLLSEYVGFKDWNTFKSEHKNSVESFSKKKKSIFWVLLILPILVISYFSLASKNQYHFCFVDNIKNIAITKVPLDIKVLQNEESPLYFKTDSLGCFKYKTTDDKITFVVQSPFHKTDTIVRHINSNLNQTVKLTTDDYALMLHYYTNGNVKDWKKHKQQLSNLISNDAQIYQLFDNSIGVELLNKEDFIRFITIPTQNLRDIEILDKTMVNGKIVKLKFIVK